MVHPTTSLCIADFYVMWTSLHNSLESVAALYINTGKYYCALVNVNVHGRQLVYPEEYCVHGNVSVHVRILGHVGTYYCTQGSFLVWTSLPFPKSSTA